MDSIPCEFHEMICVEHKRARIQNGNSYLSPGNAAGGPTGDQKGERIVRPGGRADEAVATLGRQFMGAFFRCRYALFRPST